MNNYDFDKTVDRRKTNSIKWNKDAIFSISANPEALPFWVADMDFEAEKHISEKALEIANSKAYGYPSFPLITSYFTAWTKKRHNWAPSDDSVLFSSGLLHGLSLAINVFSSIGDHILVPSPLYRPFRELCEKNGRIMDEFPLSYDASSSSFSLDLEKLEKAVKGVKIILFCSPHNPTGIVFKKEELEEVLRIAKKYDVLLLSDEIHADLVHSDAIHYPMGKVNEAIGADTITFMAPSKTFNVAGEHSAFAVFSSPTLLEKWKEKEDALFLSSPGYFIGELTQEAYKNGLEYNKALCLYLKETRDEIEKYLLSNLKEIKLCKTKASFVAFLDCSSVYEKIEKKVLGEKERYSSPSGGILSKFFGVEASVALNDGTWFSSGSKEFVRFNYGTSRKEVISALERMKKSIEAL